MWLQNDQYQAKVQKYNDRSLALVKAALDIVVAAGLLQLAPKKITPRVTGAFGFATSLISCYQVCHVVCFFCLSLSAPWLNILPCRVTHSASRTISYFAFTPAPPPTSPFCQSAVLWLIVWYKIPLMTSTCSSQNFLLAFPLNHSWIVTPWSLQPSPMVSLTTAM